MNMIAKELEKIAAFYKLDNQETLESLSKLDLGHYVEVVFTASGFEVVTGGVGREKELIEAARNEAFPEEVINAFDDFTKAFPNRMLYSKRCYGPEKSSPTLYVGVLDTWEKALSELSKLPGLDDAKACLADVVTQRKLCFLLAFSWNRDNNSLVAKTYHLASFDGKGQLPPFLISKRVLDNQFSAESKTYAAGAKWEDFLGSDKWADIAELGERLYGDKYGILAGFTERNGEVVAKKAYVMRHDKRENESYSFKTYNYYAEEGAHLTRLNEIQAAVSAFTEAIAFHRETDRSLAEIFNMRGTLYYAMQQFQNAKADFDKAIELDQDLALAHNNLSAVYLQMRDYESAIMSASLAIHMSPKMDRTNLTVAKKQYRNEEMKQRLVG